MPELIKAIEGMGLAVSPLVAALATLCMHGLHQEGRENASWPCNPSWTAA